MEGGLQSRDDGEVGGADAPARAEVAVAGGGLVGLTLGIALAEAGVEVAVIDAQAPEALTDAAYDGRSSAIAAGSANLLRSLGVWAHLEPDAQPILDIRVSDGQVGRRAAPLFLHYDSDDLGRGPFGWIVENRRLRQALFARSKELEPLRLIAPAGVAAAERADARYGAGSILARLADGRGISAQLLVAADGRNSPLRKAAGIRTVTWDYPQMGLVATLTHERPHDGVAHEHFLPSGPFAVLPMTDSPEGQHRSSLVWTERKDLASAMVDLDDAAFAAECQRRFGDSLGRISLTGPRWAYPLSLHHAQRYRAGRLVLVGDAAHGIHPIAGQGLNLGLRDVAALAECLIDARRLGLDLGAAEPLIRYERWRRPDTLMLIAVTDGLNRLFSNDLPPLRLLRDLGMAAVDRAGPLKRLLMQHAMGLVGDLPRLLKGERL
ncbi:UbiH/UbiF/VisC/COQ6 family ubiquinone biosynthesis hydroxylase [Algihabitans albus]|uniref:UbiH/UbiF/VisC/COQ6 family ubiquinone biosynthesis hydroxylase n=1 Tax=Algihabitans albus TaxID=2164067 RepID=UPI000E5D8C27|nr:UbiH/UbiF/VisC/COQ6 family ubiquinone biosynthesis hydroxylase [Algihabitans albus]